MKNKYFVYIIFPPLFQSIIYFITRLLESSPYNVNSFIDEKIPFLSIFVVFYVVWYLFLIISPLIIYKYNKELLREYALTYIICATISSIIFIFFPTTVERASLNNQELLFEKIVQLIYENDTPALNCFPSFHALASMLWIKYIGFNRNFKYSIRILISLFSICVILSTLFTAFINLILNTIRYSRIITRFNYWI